MGDYCIKDICKMKEDCVSKLRSYLDNGYECANTHEVGQVADVIKDLAEAEYYCTVTAAMTEKSDEDREMYSSKWGYDPNYVMGYRPRFSMGYRPMIDQEPYVDNYINGNKSSEYGRMYDEWKDAKRHYTESHSESDKKEMSDKTKKHVMNAVTSIREMWMESDPELKSAIKSELASLMSTM